MIKQIIKPVKLLWLSLRPPHRIMQYGTCALAYFDDRTKAERFCDNVDAFFNMLDRRFENKRRGRAIWHSYFDVGLGRRIESYSEIKKLEKEKGWLYLTPQEISREAAKNRFKNDKERKDKISRHMSDAVDQIKAGRSYARELREQAKKQGIKNLG